MGWGWRDCRSKSIPPNFNLTGPILFNRFRSLSPTSSFVDNKHFITTETLYLRLCKELKNVYVRSSQELSRIEICHGRTEGRHVFMSGALQDVLSDL